MKDDKLEEENDTTVMLIEVINHYIEYVLNFHFLRDEDGSFGFEFYEFINPIIAIGDTCYLREQ